MASLREGRWFATLYTCNYGPGGNYIRGQMYRRGDLATIPGQERMKISSQVRLARPVQEDPPAQDNIRASALDSNQIYLLLLFRLDIRSQTGSIPGRFQGFGNPA